MRLSWSLKSVILFTELRLLIKMAAKSNFIPWFSAVISAEDFEAIYRAEVPRIYRFFCYRFGEGSLAEDLTAATFEKAWRGRGRFRQQASFSTWLFSDCTARS